MFTAKMLTASAGVLLLIAILGCGCVLTLLPIPEEPPKRQLRFNRVEALRKASRTRPNWLKGSSSHAEA